LSFGAFSVMILVRFGLILGYKKAVAPS